MAQLGTNPRVIKLAKDLGLPHRGDCLADIRGFAMKRVEQIVAESPVSVDNLEVLRRIVADKFRVKLEFIYEDADVERIAAKYPSFHGGLLPRLQREFLTDDTEGITLERDEWEPFQFRYLAVIDARGDRGARAYFTAWHELTHLLIHPEQLPFPGFRRSPPPAAIAKDPLESVVDHVAGNVAFYPPFFGPVVTAEVQRERTFNFGVVETARAAAAPSASLFAATMASINYAPAPTLFVAVNMALRKDEERANRSPQQAFDFAHRELAERLRAVTVVQGGLASGSSFAIHRNMRIPDQSVLAQAYASSVDVTLTADEDQSWWEASERGRLDPLSLRVHAVRRGRFVYGLIVSRRPA
jgi:hypothetical protein